MTQDGGAGQLYPASAAVLLEEHQEPVTKLTNELK